MLSREQLQRAATDAGYSVESYEKVYTLVRLLEGLSAHPFLGMRDQLNGAGEIVPALLTDDAALQSVIQQHPGLLWKAQNVKKHVEASRPKP